MERSSHPPVHQHFKYRADIDGLRAIAVLSVVAFHAFPQWVKGGFVGVDIFFVISGFLISTIIFEGLEKNSFSFVDFYKKRIKRIFPALVFVLLFCLILGWFALFPQEYKQLGKHIMGGAGFISNFLLWFETGYFDNAAETKPLLHLWSLGIEEQFYIIWPFLIWFVWKKRLNLFSVTVLVVLISFLINVKRVSLDATAAFYSPQTRFWELLCGSLLAYITFYNINFFNKIGKRIDAVLAKIIYQKGRASNGEILKNTLSFFGIMIIAYCLYTFSKNTTFPGAWALLPVLGAIFLLAGNNSWINRAILSNRIMVWFGLISYPLYLWHWPLLSFVRIMEEDLPSRTIRLIVVGISIVLAWLTYKLIEKPIRHGIGRDRTKVAFLVGLMSIMASFGLFLQKYNGLDFRIKNLNNLNSVHDIVALPLLPLENTTPCEKIIPEFKDFKFAGDGVCVLSKNQEPDIMFLGDSHTWHYQNALWKQFPSQSVLMLVSTSCLPFSSNHFLKGECRKKYDEILAFLETNKSIKTVVLGGYWAYLMTGGFETQGTNWRTAKALDPEGTKSFLENGRYFLSKAIKGNKEIVFIKDIPDLNFNINTCFKTRPLQLPHKVTFNKECSMDRASYEQRANGYDNVVNQLLAEFPQVKIYDPRPLFCKDEKCIARGEVLPYYFNGDHLNYYGANIVIEDLKHKEHLDEKTDLAMIEPKKGKG
ncbi:acyltransferase [Legionella sp. PC1000]|uniref:acyltransferase family protein n=1 Tax=Legionella sp. PC1000 TaxID=2746060 RepID=UPI0015FE7F22|nr:acyltransferase family protein [Legionella sp. PC1000]QLZ67727.1 acyltransferase [Legionella sp. PC1000]